MKQDLGNVTQHSEDDQISNKTLSHNNKLQIGIKQFLFLGILSFPKMYDAKWYVSNSGQKWRNEYSAAARNLVC